MLVEHVHLWLLCLDTCENTMYELSSPLLFVSSKVIAKMAYKSILVLKKLKHHLFSLGLIFCIHCNDMSKCPMSVQMLY